MVKKAQPAASGKTQIVTRDTATGGWAVRASGKARATGSYKTQAEAITAAKKSAGKGANIIIHGRDGGIRQAISTSRSDELMMRVWKDIHSGSSRPIAKQRKAS